MGKKVKDFLKGGDSMNNKPFYLMEKWWGLFFAVLIPVLNLLFGLNLDPLHVAGLIIPFLALFFGGEWKEIAMMRLEAEEIRFILSSKS